MSVWRLSLAGLVLASALAAGSGFAQQPPSEARDQVVITGKADEDAIRAFVGEVTQDRSPENQLSRWDRSVCPGVAGLQSEYALVVLRRIWQRATEIGLEAGKSGCRINVLIVVTANPNGAAHELSDKYPRVVGKFSEIGQTTMGRSSLKAFEESTSPVRWWFVSTTVNEDGQRATEAPGGLAPNLVVRGASIIKRQTRQDFSRAFLIVDANKIMGVELSALADYLAMVSLAQLDARADTSGYSTILNLFAAQGKGETMSAMTPWDVAYLKGLYKAPRMAGSSRVQERDIARRMNKSAPPK